ncbi:aldehyde dehydrogenase, partial [Streptomyces sp. wa1063]|uniref:aldehyde dehydrogenase family protein n=1 Tax=Streptomyces sp. wa1063 TaxID=1828212 RepID=UPI000BF20F82
TAAAQRRWAAAAPSDRARLLRRFAVVVDEHIEELARSEVREAGHTIGNARWEAGNVRDLLDYSAGGAERLLGRQIPVSGGIDFTILEPLGVVGVIAPWNFPMPIAAWGLAPALAAGNAVLLKPAETTPLTALRLAELALQAGLPEGLFQVLPGEGPVAGSALVEHPGVAKIVFTGSTRTGKHIMTRCAERVKRLTLELGGKSPNLVFADADVEAAAAAAPMSFLDNAGQDCCARTRILVERSVYDRFLDLLVPAVSAVVVGDPADEKTQMGPLISAVQRDRVRGLVDGGRGADGGRAILGTAPEGPGF